MMANQAAASVPHPIRGATTETTQNRSMSRSWGPTTLIITGIVLLALSAFALTYVGICDTLPFSATQISFNEVFLYSIAPIIIGSAALGKGCANYSTESRTIKREKQRAASVMRSTPARPSVSSGSASAGQPPAAPTLSTLGAAKAANADKSAASAGAPIPHPMATAASSPNPPPPASERSDSQANPGGSASSLDDGEGDGEVLDQPSRTVGSESSMPVADNGTTTARIADGASKAAEQAAAAAATAAAAAAAAAVAGWQAGLDAGGNLFAKAPSAKTLAAAGAYAAVDVIAPAVTDAAAAVLKGASALPGMISGFVAQSPTPQPGDGIDLWGAIDGHRPPPPPKGPPPSTPPPPPGSTSSTAPPLPTNPPPPLPRPPLS